MTRFIKRQRENGDQNAIFLLLLLLQKNKILLQILFLVIRHVFLKATRRSIFLALKSLLQPNDIFFLLA